MKNILVVEDTASIREEVCEILKMEGFNVFEAENGMIGLDIAKKELPNLIISDIVMPELSGFDFFKEITDNISTMNIPIIFLSARADIESVNEAIEMGVVEYIIKPVSPDILINIVNKKLENS